MKSENRFLLDLLEADFYDNMKNERTKLTYQKVINDVQNQFEKNYLELSVANLMSFLNDQMKLYMEKKVTYSTYFVRFYILKSYSMYLADNAEKYGYSYENPFLYIKAPEDAGFLTMYRIPKEAQIQKILDHARESQKDIYILLAILIRCAVRLNDSIKIKKSDVRMDDTSCKLLIHPARGKSYYVHCPDDLANLLKEHIADKKENEFLITNKYSQALTMRRLEKIYKRVMLEMSDVLTMQDIRNGAIATMLQHESKQAVADKLHVQIYWLYRYDAYLKLYDTDYNRVNLLYYS